MRMMFTPSATTHIAQNATTMKSIRIVLSMTTDTNLNPYSMAILSDISALSLRSTEQVKIQIMLTKYLLSPTGAMNISTLKETAH